MYRLLTVWTISQWFSCGCHFCCLTLFLYMSLTQRSTVFQPPVVTFDPSTTPRPAMVVMVSGHAQPPITQTRQHRMPALYKSIHRNFPLSDHDLLPVLDKRQVMHGWCDTSVCVLCLINISHSSNKSIYMVETWLITILF